MPNDIGVKEERDNSKDGSIYGLELARSHGRTGKHHRP